jgi:GntR family transcriptional regulator / MocR family aminotransferase
MAQPYDERGLVIRSNSMRVEWSGLSPELLVGLDRSKPGTLGAQVQHELREAVRSGRLAAGERLPSTRVLARELGISRGLAQECYEQLVAEGYLIARSGSGTRVAAARAINRPTAAPVAPPAFDVEFAIGKPDIASFPMRNWVWALNEAARTAPLRVAEYGDAAGRPELRTVLAAYLQRVRAAVATPETVVVTSGFTQALALVLHVLADHNHRLLGVEDPGHRAWRELATRAGLRPAPVPVDDDGARITDAGPGMRAVVLTPAHQTPTGAVLSPERRREIVAWADRQPGLIIEDDYDAEFRYDRQAVGAMQGLAPDRVFLIGSVSKVLGPSLRIGWVVCPPEFVAEVEHAKRFADRGTPALDQLALAQLIQSGRYDRHLRRMRTVYARKRDALIDALAEHAPAVQLTGSAAGFHAVARLSATADEVTVSRAARARRVRVEPMANYHLTEHDHPPQLVLGFGDLSEAAIRHGIATIGDLLDPEHHRTRRKTSSPHRPPTSSPT